MTRRDYRTDWNFSLSIISIFLSFFRIPKESYRDCCPLLCRLKYWAAKRGASLFPFSCEIACASINFMQDWCFAFMLCLRTCALTKSVNQSTVSKLPNSKMGKKLFAFLYRVSKQVWNRVISAYVLSNVPKLMKVRWIFSDLPPYLTSPHFLEL